MKNIDQRRINNQQSEFLPAAEAARLLDVKPATLYSYVSRGLLRSVSSAQGRPRRYAIADLMRLKARRDARRGHRAVAAGALRWGDPVLDSAITQIQADGPHYRGRSALSLAAAGLAFEDVAQLLWSGTLPDRGAPQSAGQPHTGFGRFGALLPDDCSPIDVLSAWVPLAAARDPDRFDTAPAAEVRRGHGLLRGMAVALGLKCGSGAAASRHAGRVAQLAAASFGARRPNQAAAALDQALILCADHELNVSTFAARVAASAGADLYACVSAGIAAVSGPRHGGVCDRLEHLVLQCGRPQGVRATLRERARLDLPVPGFGHPLYPEGDPRGRPLLELAARIAPRNRRVSTCQALAEHMQQAGHGGPCVDVALVAVCFALGLPPGAATGLFALGRTAGWVAHVLEQRESPELLRPRARFVGPGSGVGQASDSGGVP